MKAISPVRSVRSCYEAVCCLSEQSLAIARGGGGGGGGKGGPPPEEPLGLLYDMNGCYSKLRELVPGIPQGSQVSQVELLQHVIDYIFDLQIVLQEQGRKKKGHKGQRRACKAGQEGGTPLALQAAELASELCSKDERTHCH